MSLIGDLRILFHMLTAQAGTGADHKERLEAFYRGQRNAYDDFRKRVDYSEYGGVPLLGVRGVSIIGHGRSNALAIKNAIRVAAECAEGRVNEKIEAELEGRQSAQVAV